MWVLGLQGHSFVESSAFGESVKLMKNDTSFVHYKSGGCRQHGISRLDPGTEDITGDTGEIKYIWRLVHGIVFAS